MKSKQRHPIIIQEVYDTNKIRKIRVPMHSNSAFTPALQHQIDMKRYILNNDQNCISNSSTLPKSSSYNSGSSHFSSSSSLSSSRSSLIKKLIISEKITAYQLNLEKSSSVKAITSHNSPNSPVKSATLLKLSSSSLDHYFDSFIEDDEDEVDEEEDDDNELTEDDVDFLLANTGFSVEQIERWHAEFKLKCAKCLIEYDQFKIYYKSILPGYVSDERQERLIHSLFKLFDIDADGYLNFTEFLVSFWIRFKAPVAEKFTWLFNMFDEDRNGCLSHAEMTQALSLCMNADDLAKLLELLKNESEEISASQAKLRRQNEQRQFDKDSLIDTDCSSSDAYDSFDEYENDEDDFQETEYGIKDTRHRSIEEKINECLILMEFMCKSKLEENDVIKKDWAIIGCDQQRKVSDENSQFFYKNSVGYFKYMMGGRDRRQQAKRVQFTRERFLFLCERYKPLRKLLLPIKCFYDEATNSNKQ